MKQCTLYLLACFVSCVFASGCELLPAAPADDAAGDEARQQAEHLAGCRPNLVLIIADDVSFNDLGCYGNADVRTPRLDAMAAQGRLWTDAYLTTSQCSPTRCSILTGRYPHNTGAPELHTPLPADQWCFTQSLRDAGYWCAQAGKWHMGNPAKDSFDVVHGGRGGGPGGEGRWVQTLRDRPTDQPFFCWFASNDAHRSWQPDSDAQPHEPAALTLPEPLVDTPTTREDLAQYYDEVQRLDRYVGEVLDELERQGVLDNTLVLFIADNGRPFPRAKRWLVTDGIKTPFILHWPAGLAGGGGTCEGLVSVLDIAPTFLQLAGAQIPDSFQGRSFLPQVVDPEAVICDMVFAERNWHGEYAHERMVRRGNWVYLRNASPELSHLAAINIHRPYPGFQDLERLRASGEPLSPAQQDVFLAPRPAEQLFYLPGDTLMLNDLAADPTHRQTLAELSALMDQWQEATGDTVPGPEARTPDRNDRVTGEPILPGRGSGHPVDGEMPGESAGAERINESGPR